jgi:transcription elongation factor GreA
LSEERAGATEERITVGTTVKLAGADSGGRTVTFTVVRPAEANPGEGKISEAAPMAEAVVGRRVGDEVVAVTPQGERRYRIADARR